VAWRKALLLDPCHLQMCHSPERAAPSSACMPPSTTLKVVPSVLQVHSRPVLFAVLCLAASVVIPC
jgi:hypothetical protein